MEEQNKHSLTSIQSYKVQLVRGLSIIAVVAIHNTPGGLFQVWCRPFLNFAVGTFLFLSGMLSKADKWNPKKRIIKVVIPYAFWTLVYVLMNNINTISKLPLEYIKNFITGNSAAIMYYVFVYCEFTLLLPLIDKLAHSKYRFIGFLISPLEIIIMRLLPLVFHVTLNSHVLTIINISCIGWFIYYYLGYLIGNDLLKIKFSQKTLWIFLFVSVILQVLEGYEYLSLKESNCGTQLKLTAILTGVIFNLILYRFISSDRVLKIDWLYKLGNYSFGIYFSHLAIMTVLNHIPYYSKFVRFPVNVLVTLLISSFCVWLGKKILGRKSKYIAF